MSAGLRLGLFSVNSYACSRPETAARVARQAETCGFDSLWAGEHVVLPDPRVPPSPMDPGEPILDPLVSLAFLAAHTKTVLLGTGIVILPQRNPLVLAKQVASLDAVSGERLILGVGAGYLEPELNAIGVPMSERGGRTDEFLAAMRELWYAERPAYEGRFVRFSGVQAHPRPRRVPIVVGGHTPAAHRRAVEQGHGWYGFGLDLAATAAQMEGLREAMNRYARPAELGDLEISVTPRGTPDREAAARFAELGVHRLVLLPRRERDETALVDYVARTGETLLGAGG
ncbi:MAG TPA: LLM class F420-dependent oxidoreductase [Terriglobales bacterium]|nr:LLM class F420-dependent oxidoreductase [Terriglobales bacterium]